MKTQFLYFLRDVTETPKREKLEELGLAYALAGESLMACGVSNGPDGSGGMIVCADGDQRIGFYPADQKWRPLNDRVFVGWNTVGLLPGPSDLQRQTVLAGHDVELGDGRLWIAPKARAWSTALNGELISGAALPGRLELNDSGRWSRGAALPVYAALEAIAGAWFDKRFATEAQEPTTDGSAVLEFSFADAPTKATQCLAVSYRIGPVEADILGIWTTQTVVKVLDAAIDYPSLIDIMLKKKWSPRTDRPSLGGRALTGLRADAGGPD